MLAKVFSCAVIGLDGVVVQVEADTGLGLPSFVIVGLPDAAVQESRERIGQQLRSLYTRPHGATLILNYGSAPFFSDGRGAITFATDGSPTGPLRACRNISQAVLSS